MNSTSCKIKGTSTAERFRAISARKSLKLITTSVESKYFMFWGVPLEKTNIELVIALMSSDARFLNSKV